jgi:hypothetical protein
MLHTPRQASDCDEQAFFVSGVLVRLWLTFYNGPRSRWKGSIIGISKTYAS